MHATTPKLNRQIVFIRAYAPTYPVKESKSSSREELYHHLKSVIKTVDNRALLYVVGDFNVQRGIRGYDACKQNMGRYSKGLLNSSGESPFQLASQNYLILPNTLYPVSPGRKHHRGIRYKNGGIKLIIYWQEYNIKNTLPAAIHNSGMHIITNLQLVTKPITITNFRTKMTIKKEITHMCFKDPTTRAKYVFGVEMHLMDKKHQDQGQSQYPQGRCNHSQSGAVKQQEQTTPDQERGWGDHS